MMDYEKIKAGVQLMLEGIGEDVTREGLLETPDRIARMCAEIYGGLYEDASSSCAARSAFSYGTQVASIPKRPDTIFISPSIISGCCTK